MSKNELVFFLVKIFRSFWEVFWIFSDFSKKKVPFFDAIQNMSHALSKCLSERTLRIIWIISKSLAGFKKIILFIVPMNPQQCWKAKLERALGRSENLEVPVLFGGHNLTRLVEIGLTDLPKSGGVIAPPAPQGTTGLECFYTVQWNILSKVFQMF